MKNILILGAGLVSEPGIQYLLSQENFKVTVADQDRSKAVASIKGHPDGNAIGMDVSDEEALQELIKNSDIVVSLLPWTFHVGIARICLKENKDLVTASYVSEEMAALDQNAKDKGLIFLNEIGLDPGYDHMSAMEVIDRINSDGGKIISFESITGGLPSPDDNDNPFGYKFSWSPKGVILASTNSAEYLKDGKVIKIPGENLFLNYWPDSVDPIGEMEIYPNRNSTPYKDIYKLKDAETVFRGTYRYPGWCKTMKALVDLGWLNDNIPGEGTYLEYMARVTGAQNITTGDVLVSTAEHLDLTLDSGVIFKMDWLGLFNDTPLPSDTSAIDILCSTMEEKMQFKANEKDMVVMQHKFGYETASGEVKQITSTMIEYGIPGGYSAMARTVSLPLASAVKCILDDKIRSTGVCIPTTKEIYKPILKELENSGIKMKEIIS